MNDKIRYEVETQFTTSGAEGTEAAFRRIQDLVDSEARSKNINEKQTTALSKAIYRQAQALDGASSATKQYSTAASSSARGTGEMGEGINALNGSLPSLRYAMYDVAQTAGTMSAALTGAGVGLLAASASYESSFTAVERTSGVTGTAVLGLRDDLIDLSRAIPQSFGEISDLAARGAQLGVSSDQLGNFTRTVAEFVATSDTVTSGQAVEAFGRISNLLGDTDFNRIGSAITLVGVNAAATEGQIVKTTQELAPFGAAAGLASDEVIALATALASLGQPPERARSAFLSLQSVMDNAVAGLNEKLPVFANLLGQSSEEVAKLWQTDPGTFISSFVSALGATENLTVALSDLGLNEKRATQVFQALAADSANAGDGLSVLNQAFADSEKGYTEGTELARQYGLIVDDLASKWQIFVNGLGEVASALGDILAPAAKATLDVLSQVVQGIADFARTPFGKGFYGVALVLGGIAAAAAGLLASLALGVATLAAFRTAIEQLGLAGGRAAFSLKGLSAALTETAVAAGFSARSITVFKTALISTGIGALVVALGSLAAAFTMTGQTAQQAFDSYVGNTGGLSEALAADQAAYQEALSSGNQALAEQYIQIGAANKVAATGTDENTAAMRSAADLLGVTLSATETVSDAVSNQSGVIGENTLAWLNNSLVQSDAFQKLASNSDFVKTWQEYGLSINDVLEAAAADGEQGVLNLFTRMGNAANNGAGVFATGIQQFFIRLGDSWNHFWGQFAGQVSESWNALMSGDFKGIGAIQQKYSKSLSLGFDKIWTTPTLTTGVRDFAKAAAGGVATARELAGATKGAGQAMQDLGDDAAGAAGGLDDAGKSAQDTAEKLYTLVDYANDLSSVWKRAFDIRFGASSSMDGIANTWQKLRDAAADAAKKVRDLRASIQELQADSQSLKSDISILEYYKSIAEAYGDTKRASAIDAELAKKRADLTKTSNQLADKNSELKKTVDSQSKSTVGNTQAARDNRAALQDLASQYQGHIQNLAAAGLSQGELQRETERLKQEFIAQAVQMGFTRAEATRVARAFDDVAAALRAVPRKITIDTSGLGPAQKAIAEFAARAAAQMNNVARAAGGAQNAIGGASGAANAARGAGAGAYAQYEYSARLAAIKAQAFANIYALNAQMLAVGTGIGGAVSRASILAQIAIWRQIGGFSSGGYTGSGGMYEVAGMVHRGEYVIPKRDVNQATGLPYADALGRLSSGAPSRTVAAPSPTTTQGVTTVDLSAGTIQALAQATGKNIYLDGKLVADASANVYAQQNTVGAY